MFVEHSARAPAQPLTDVHHREREVRDLRRAHGTRRAGREERRKLDVGEGAIDGIAHDFPKIISSQRSAVNLGADEPRGFGGVGVTEGRPFIRLRLQAFPGRL
jgi:hypothetical protein